MVKRTASGRYQKGAAKTQAEYSNNYNNSNNNEKNSPKKKAKAEELAKGVPLLQARGLK